MIYTILRNNTQFSVKLQDFRSNDLVLSQDGCFYSVSAFPELGNYFPQLTTPDFSEVFNGIGQTILITVGIIGLVTLIDDLLQPCYNIEPLTQRIRNIIRERDEEICFYCSVYVPDGHVDHRISRFNGGGNDFDNLTWACVSCNCSKGAMNDYDFIKCFN